MKLKVWPLIACLPLACWQPAASLKTRQKRAGTRSFVHDRCTHVEEVIDPHDYHGTDPVTPEVCHTYCLQFKAFYFGLRNGGSCWCGNMFNEYIGAGPGICDLPCKGDPHFRCGGKDATDVFIMAGPECGRQIEPPVMADRAGAPSGAPEPGGGDGDCPGGDCGDGGFHEPDAGPGKPSELPDCDENGIRPLQQGEVELDFSKSEVLANNLGDEGPSGGAEELRFKGVASVGSESVDLVIAAESSYIRARGIDNGLSGGLVKISLRADTSVDLRLKFVSTKEGTPVDLDSFQVTIFEIEQNKIGEAQKSVTASGFAEYFLSEHSDLIMEVPSSGGKLFTSEAKDDGEPAPTDPLKLTAAQANRGVAFLYASKSEARLTLSVGSSSSGDATFLIGGRSGISGCGVEVIEAPDAREAECADPSLEVNREVVLDFKSSEVNVNNLGGVGPDDTAPKELRFRNIGTAPDGKSVDLVVEAVGAYDGPGLKNGLSSGFGKVVIGQDDSVELAFKFKATVDSASVELPMFYFSFLDMTSAKTAVISGFDEYWVSDPSSMEVKVLRDESVHFKSTAAGSSGALDSSDITAAQGRQSVTYLFMDTSEFRATLSASSATSFLLGGKEALVV